MRKYFLISCNSYAQNKKQKIIDGLVYNNDS